MLGSILGPAGVEWSQQENDIVGDEDGGELTVSLERLNEAVGDADVILYGTDLNQKPTENYENMSESDMFQSLNAVKDSKVYPIGKMTVAGYTDAMATLDMLERSEERRVGTECKTQRDVPVLDEEGGLE